MPSTVPPAQPAADLGRLQPAGASHQDVRRCSRARRNLLPRTDLVTSVCARWAHEVVLRADARVEVALWCPGERRDLALEDVAGRIVARAERAYRVSARVLARKMVDIANNQSSL